MPKVPRKKLKTPSLFSCRRVPDRSYQLPVTRSQMRIMKQDNSKSHLNFDAIHTCNVTFISPLYKEKMKKKTITNKIKKGKMPKNKSNTEQPDIQLQPEMKANEDIKGASSENEGWVLQTVTALSSILGWM